MPDDLAHMGVVTLIKLVDLLAPNLGNPPPRLMLVFAVVPHCDTAGSLRAEPAFDLVGPHVDDFVKLLSDLGSVLFAYVLLRLIYAPLSFVHALCH